VKGAGKSKRPKRILTYIEWERFIENVTAEPQRTTIITAMCLGVRREEVWALKWSDFDFASSTVMIQRTIIGGKVYEKTKNEASEAPLPLDESLVRLLLDWHSKSEFNKDSDWVWASPWSAGEMPLYFNAVQRDYIILGCCRPWQDRLALPAPYLPLLVERCRNSAWSPERPHAPCHDRDNCQRLRRGCPRRNAAL
jgi:integrase